MPSDEVASRDSVEQLDARLSKLERVRARESKPAPKAAAVFAAVLSIPAVVVLASRPAPENATVAEYFIQMVGLGAVFVAGAGITKGLHQFWPKAGWDSAEEVVKASGLFFLAIVAVARFGFAGYL